MGQPAKTEVRREHREDWTDALHDCVVNRSILPFRRAAHHERRSDSGQSSTAQMLSAETGLRDRFLTSLFSLLLSVQLVPKLASTVLVMARAPASAFAVRGNLYKLLFIQRASSSGFMANAHVFPGGVLDKDDEADGWKASSTIAPAADGTSGKPGSYPIRSDKRDSLAMRICALRELFEETGLLLARSNSATTAASSSSSASASPSPFTSSVHSFLSPSDQRDAQKTSSASAASLRPLLTSLGLAFEPHKLAPWSRWITPVFEKRRYDTLFYLAALDEPVASLTPDPAEVAEARWLSPVEALDLARQRKIVLPPPTTYILRELEFVRALEEVFAAAPDREMPAILPRLLPSTGMPAEADASVAAPMMHITLPGDPCYPMDDEGTLPSTAHPLASTQQWHRMIRCSDAKVDPITRIHRPAHLHLKPSPPEADSKL